MVEMDHFAEKMCILFCLEVVFVLSELVQISYSDRGKRDY